MICPWLLWPNRWADFKLLSVTFKIWILSFSTNTFLVHCKSSCLATAHGQSREFTQQWKHKWKKKSIWWKKNNCKWLLMFQIFVSRKSSKKFEPFWVIQVWSVGLLRTQSCQVIRPYPLACPWQKEKELMFSMVCII